MQCGAKCFIVTFEKDGYAKTESIISRTPVNARKLTRTKYGKDIKIVSVIQDKD